MGRREEKKAGEGERETGCCEIENGISNNPRLSREMREGHENSARCIMADAKLTGVALVRGGERKARKRRRHESRGPDGNGERTTKM